MGTISTWMRPSAPTRGVTSSEMPHEKKASLANIILSSPGIALIFMSRSTEVELSLIVFLTAIVTFGYFVVMSTVALRPEATMIFGFENMRASSLDSSARRIT